MIAIPAIERWRDVHRSVDESRIERHRERQVSQGTNAKCKSQGERVKRAGCEPGNNQRRNQQTIIVYERQKNAGCGEDSSRKKKYAPWPEQTAEVDAKGPDKHQSRVVRAVEPCGLIVTDTEMAPQICHPQRKHATGKRDQPRADQDPDDPQYWSG